MTKTESVCKGLNRLLQETVTQNMSETQRFKTLMSRKTTVKHLQQHLTENVAKVSQYAGADDDRDVTEMKYIDRVDNEVQMFRPFESFLGGNRETVSLHSYFSLVNLPNKRNKIKS